MSFVKCINCNLINFNYSDYSNYSDLEMDHDYSSFIRQQEVDRRHYHCRHGHDEVKPQENKEEYKYPEMIYIRSCVCCSFQGQISMYLGKDIWLKNNITWFRGVCIRICSKCEL